VYVHCWVCVNFHEHDFLRCDKRQLFHDWVWRRICVLGRIGAVGCVFVQWRLRVHIDDNNRLRR
jgi:hypothetical protein